MAARIGAFVPRPESRDRLGRFMRVTVAGDTRRNGWQLAEAAAEATPHGMQRLVASAAWDVDGVRNDLRAYVVEAALTDRSERTVRQHAVAVYQKSGLRGRAELAAFFLEGVELPSRR